VAMVSFNYDMKTKTKAQTIYIESSKIKDKLLAACS